MPFKLRPSQILFSKTCISTVFDKETFHAGVCISETLSALFEGRCKVTSIPTIKVCKIEGKWFSLDNKRLWIFKHLERLGKCEEIPVLSIEKPDLLKDMDLSETDGGKTVFIRGYWWAPDPRCSEDQHTLMENEIDGENISTRLLVPV
ncbi:hypothetical protein CHS0354_033566 [Potamilus streckersoni]|uniref:Uncharacterized protein n=1 Tax=Potamilus streckersoni TaxID=2493646 RepID=A0AAE0W5X3_9BIVA|nr:hypothetical protein CHS0354_033566 [Potamilus streckersoni]